MADEKHDDFSMPSASELRSKQDVGVVKVFARENNLPEALKQFKSALTKLDHKKRIWVVTQNVDLPLGQVRHVQFAVMDMFGPGHSG